MKLSLIALSIGIIAIATLAITALTFQQTKPPAPPHGEEERELNIESFSDPCPDARFYMLAVDGGNYTVDYNNPASQLWLWVDTSCKNNYLPLLNMYTSILAEAVWSLDSAHLARVTYTNCDITYQFTIPYKNKPPYIFTKSKTPKYENTPKTNAIGYGYAEPMHCGICLPPAKGNKLRHH